MKPKTAYSEQFKCKTPLVDYAGITGLAGFYTEHICHSQRHSFFRWLLSLVKYVITALYFGRQHCIRRYCFYYVTTTDQLKNTKSEYHKPSSQPTQAKDYTCEKPGVGAGGTYARSLREVSRFAPEVLQSLH